tara:strand:- start:3888 stop:3998 length:111 start_codon:yes stop_codon:yes gene_type:complete
VPIDKICEMKDDEKAAPYKDTMVLWITFGLDISVTI